MKQKLIFIGAGLVVLVVVVRLVMMQSSSGDVAVDTTGASAGANASARNAAPTASTSPQSSGTPGATAAAKPTGPTPTPVVVQISGTAVSVEAKPLLLLNPSTVRQGSSVGVAGSGFDPGAVVDIYVKQQAQDTVDPLTFVQIDKSGGFGGVSFNVPDTLPRGNFIVEADQRDSDNLARATAVVAGGSPQVKLGTQAAKSGDVVQLSAAGFSSGEDINVYWNDLAGEVIGTLQADDSGGIRQGEVHVPFGAVGNNGFIFVGQTSQSPVTVPFQMLNLYPSVDLSSYAIKPDNVLSFSGKDFGPGENVTVYLNNPDGPPLTTVHTDDTGGFTNSGGFLVPFGLQGKQTLIFVGTQSKAPTTASFDTLPYTPSAQPSTYGGRPGTTLTFYAIGFARNEIVHAFINHTQMDPGTEVTCFRTDGQGNAASGGSYVVPGDASAGQLLFSLMGSRSQATASAALEVIASDVPVQVPPQAPFACDLTDGPDAPQVVGVVEGPAAVSAPAPSARASAFLSPSPSPVAKNAAAASSSSAASKATQAAAPAGDAPASPGSKAKLTPVTTQDASPSTQTQASPAAAKTTLSTAQDASQSADAPVSTTAKAKATEAAADASPAAQGQANAATANAKPAAKPSAATEASPVPQKKSATPVPTAAASQAAAVARPQTYTVESGDTLPAIAAQLYGDANQWTLIYDANRTTIGEDPNTLPTGAQLSVPAKES
jgi:nucleoid-associated protein YgaU